MRKSILLPLIALLGAGAVAIYLALPTLSGKQASPITAETVKKKRPVPVEVAAIETAPISLRRTFSGALEAHSEFMIAPKISGRVERIEVDLGDTVARGQIVGELDNDEYLQAVTQAEADLAVARANLSVAANDLDTAERDLERITTLRKRGVASEAQFDAAKANQQAREAHKKVAQAQVQRAESLLATGKIRLGYTKIIAEWRNGSSQRVVAERFVDEGDTVSANTPLLRIVELNPIVGVFFVTERDYGRLEVGQLVRLATDAYPGESFPGRIARIAPVFKDTTRQARIELLVDNTHQRLKPGMFVRATIVLEHREEATTVPIEALAKRNDETGLFVVTDDTTKVRWQPVTTGIVESGRVEIRTPRLTGRVVTLGQQQLADGSPILIPVNHTE